MELYVITVWNAVSHLEIFGLNPNNKVCDKQSIINDPWEGQTTNLCEVTLHDTCTHSLLYHVHNMVKQIISFVFEPFQISSNWSYKPQILKNLFETLCINTSVMVGWEIELWKLHFWTTAHYTLYWSRIELIKLYPVPTFLFKIYTLLGLARRKVYFMPIFQP